MTTSLSSRQALESPGFSRGEDVNKKTAFLAVAAVVALVPFVFMVATYLYVLLYILFALLSR